MTIRTTSGRVFTVVEHVDMARLIFKRFGEDIESATAAWCRLLQNNTTQAEFVELLCYPEHTYHCDGHCQVDAQEHDHELAMKAIK